MVILTHGVCSNDKNYSSVKDLKYAIENAWFKIKPEVIQNHILSIEDSIFKVIQQHGTVIKYYFFFILF